MTWPSPHLDRVYIEVRFSRRLAFLDHIGMIADAFEGPFDEASITDVEPRLSSEAGDELTLDPGRVVVNSRHGDKDWAMSQVARAIEIYVDAIGLQEVDYVGARQVVLQDVGDVAEATALFRRTFFNYKEGPLVAFGKYPIEAQARAAFRLEDGTCKITATAISRARSSQERGSEAPPGALFLDVDRANDQGTTQPLDVVGIAEGLLTDGWARAVDFISGLKDLDPDAEKEGEPPWEPNLRPEPSNS